MRWLATRQDSYVPEDENLQVMLALKAKKRACHAGGHKDCKGHWVTTGETPEGKPTGFKSKKCTPGPDGNCRECKDECVSVLVTHRKALIAEANRILNVRTEPRRPDTGGRTISGESIHVVGGVVEV